MQKYRNRLIVGFVVALVIYAVYVFAAELLVKESVFAHLAAFPLVLLIPLSLLQLVANFFRWVEWHYYLVTQDTGRRASVAVTMEGPKAAQLAQADRMLVEAIELFRPTPETQAQAGAPTVK